MSVYTEKHQYLILLSPDGNPVDVEIVNPPKFMDKFISNPESHVGVLVKEATLYDCLKISTSKPDDMEKVRSLVCDYLGVEFTVTTITESTEWNSEKPVNYLELAKSKKFH